MKHALVVLASIALGGCATLTEDKMTPISMSFSDGSNGKCELSNKRGLWNTDVPAVVSVRKSDDALKYRCKTDDGREASGTIASEMGGKIVASAVFLDFGITDAITDKHRKYAVSYVVPMRSRDGAAAATTPGALPAASASAADAMAPGAAPAPAPVLAATPAPAAGTAAAPAASQAAAPAPEAAPAAASTSPAFGSAAADFAKATACQAPKNLSTAGGVETWQAECVGGQFRIFQCDAAGCRQMH